MVEAAVALGIIVTAVSSSLTLVMASIRAEKESETDIVAANLAREGIEAVRAIRDSNWLASRPFDSGLVNLGDCTAIPVFAADKQPDGFWSVDYSPSGFNDDRTEVWRYAPGAQDPQTEGLFVQALQQPEGTVASGFQRLLTIEEVCVDTDGTESVSPVCGGCPASQQEIGLRVRSDIRWTVNTRVENMSVEEWLYDWR